MNLLQTLENVLQAAVAGLLTGSIYGLMCVGLALIFGVMRVINFAQGDFMMLGMYAAYYLFGLLGVQTIFGNYLGPYVAILLAAPVLFFVGPTYVMTPELQARLDSGVRDLGKMMHVHALDFLPTPADIAEAIAFLCSPVARAITGILLPVDSGWTASATYMTYAGGVPWEQEAKPG